MKRLSAPNMFGKDCVEFGIDGTCGGSVRTCIRNGF